MHLADIEGYGRKGQRSHHHIHLVGGLLPCGLSVISYSGLIESIEYLYH
jgi:hypothetical protein